MKAGALHLQTEDFGDLSPEMRAAFARLLRILKPQTEGVASALSETMPHGYVSLRFQTGATLTPGSAPFVNWYVQKPFPGRPMAMLFAWGRNESNPNDVFATVPVATWDDMGDGRIKLRWVSGLSASTKYELRFLLLGE